MVMEATRSKATGQRPAVYSEQCSGCGYCQLACSFVKTKVFNPAASLIKLRRVDGKERYSISFSADCDGCGYCARYCFYGVLKSAEK